MPIRMRSPVRASSSGLKHMSDATSDPQPRVFLVYRGLRRVDDGASLEWPDARRKTFLLKKEVRIPWSLDTRVLPESAGETRDAIIAEVACTVIDAGPSSGADAWRGSELLEACPSFPEWEFMGYDICDATGTSGLSNCSYSSSEIDELRTHWAEALNEYHLFHRLDDALSYRQLTDARVSDHAPFAVVGIWRIARRVRA
jgi:hypothetical protein